VAQGNPLLRPGQKVTVAEVAPFVSGLYVLTSVNHIIDDKVGFISEISTSPPTPPALNHTPAVSTGTVTRIDDPDKLGRVCVSLPVYRDVETGWMEVLSVGAGQGKGLVALPAAGDQVLVLFSQGDPAQGLVLGGLYGVNGPPDSGIEGGEVRRYTLVTPGGQRLTLDDATKTIRLETSEKSYIEFAPETIKLHAEADLELEAPGHRVVIRGQKIDFEKA
jgi:phage baseplate assembly protein V